MKLNRENYGIFIIDYLDGNLSEAEKERLLLFLDDNPDLKEEFTNLDQTTLEKPQVSFPGKEKLKIPITKSTRFIDKNNYESFFVLSHDGELNAEEEADLKQFLVINPHLSKEMQLFGKVRLEKDEKVVFPDKAALKHRRPVTIQLSFAMAAAAMLLIYVGFRFLTPGENTIPTPKQNTRLAALNAVPALALSSSITFTESLRLKSQPKAVISKPVQHKIKIQKQAPVQMLASLDAPAHFDNLSQGTSLMASRAVASSQPAQPHPVVVEESHQSLLASVVTKPIDKLAGLFARRKKERMKNNEHSKPLVNLLAEGVKTFNLLTNNNVVFVQTYNTKGDLTGYHVLSDNFKIDHNITAPPK